MVVTLDSPRMPPDRGKHFPFSTRIALLGILALELCVNRLMRLDTNGFQISTRRSRVSEGDSNACCFNSFDHFVYDLGIQMIVKSSFNQENVV